MKGNERKAENKMQKNVGAILRTCSQKGITLIALIITIIVMLILVGVTINVALNGGLFTTAQTATKETQIEAEREKLLSAVVASYETETGTISKSKLELNLGNGWKVEGEEGGPYTATSPKRNVFTVDENGTINYKGKNTIGGGGTPTVDSTVPDELTKYIMGENGTGRVLNGTDEEGNDIGILKLGNTSEFLDDPLTEDVNEKETLGVEYLTVLPNEDYSKYLIYFKYAEKAYAITMDMGTYESENLNIAYEPKGTEGQKTADGWTILYDNGKTVEAVSPETMGNLNIGYSETATTEEKQLEESIYAYNNAITIINEYCETLPGLPTNTGVRNVGLRTETSDIDENKFFSDNIEEWNKEYNGKGKKSDTNWGEDLIRMCFWGVAAADESKYWLNARTVYNYRNSFGFEVLYVGDEASLHMKTIWSVRNTGVVEAGGTVPCSVRPIITTSNIN